MDVLGIIIKIILTTNYQLLLNCNKVHRARTTPMQTTTDDLRPFQKAQHCVPHQSQEGKGAHTYRNATVPVGRTQNNPQLVQQRK
jgi:hypothetical protein